MDRRTESARVAVAKATGKSPRSFRPVHRSDLTAYEIDDDLLLYDPTTGDTHRLNDTARRVWDRCDGRRTTNALADDLTRIYDVSAEKALTHVERLLTEMQQRRLLESTD